jgi:superfamily II DNA or RNA helicase
MTAIHFDRGTLVVQDPRRPASLPGVAWDARTACWRAPAWRYGELKTALGLPERAQAARPFAAELRPYQQAALNAWELSGRRGTVVLPTGAGKTHVALAAIARCGGCALVLVPTRVLMHQWAARLEEAGLGPVGRYGDGLRELQPVTVCTTASAWRHMPTLGRRFALLVVDEAHHFGGGLHDEALEMSAAIWRLGLTATPRDPTPSSEAPGWEHLIGPVAYRITPGALLGTEYLADLALVTLTVDLTPRERTAWEQRRRLYREAWDRWRALAPRGSWTDFVGWAARTPQGRLAITAHRQARTQLGWCQGKQALLRELLPSLSGRRHLVFTADNRAALAVSREHLLAPITCDIGAKERDAVLERFREGSLWGLVSSRVLNEGLDVPDADVAVLVGGSQGTREYLQRIGRVLRPRPGKQAVIYELVVRQTPEERTVQSRHMALEAP